MSDPVTNMEIEDVLSSIRRLVSSDERSRPAEEVPAPERPEPGRLVLTPSLRVDATATQTAPVPEADELPTVPETEGHDVEGCNGAGMDAPDDSVDATPPHDSKALKARVAELEEVVSRQGDQWDPDGATNTANSGSPVVASVPWEDYISDADADADAEDDTVADTDTWEHGDEGTADSVAASVVEAQAKDAAHGHAADDIPNNFVTDDRSNTAQPEMDSAGDFRAANDEFLDEDALRDLVADIVREELQGALGERITRNVRKLVRREIHRALASQELQ